MDTSLVLSVIGDDRPGLVEALAELVAADGGNWLESSLAQLAGKFAGIVRVSVAEEAADKLAKSLEGFSALQVRVARASKADAAGRYSRAFSLSLVGHDRVGIVREVTQALARHDVNVEQLETYVSAAPMSGEQLFHAEARLMASGSSDLAALRGALEALSNELFVDINFEEAV